MTGNGLFLVGMLLSFGAILCVVFCFIQIFIMKKLWAKVDEFTELCVRMVKFCVAAEENETATKKAYKEALAEKQFAVGEDGNIVVMPKINEAG